MTVRGILLASFLSMRWRKIGWAALTTVALGGCVAAVDGEGGDTRQNAGVYGVDDRQEIYELSEPQRSWARATAFLVPRFDLVPAGRGQLLILGADFGQSMEERRVATLADRMSQAGSGAPLCPDEPFQYQPARGDVTGSGVLIAPDVLATAAHCATDCAELAIVFDYALSGPPSAGSATDDPAAQYHDVAVVPETSVRYCRGVITHPQGIDAALVILDRPMTDRSPRPLSQRTGPATPNTPVTLIGHPQGLPAKASSGRVLDPEVAKPRWNLDEGFLTNVDAYHGNSGSGVLNDSGAVEGVLVDGDRDFVNNYGFAYQGDDPCEPPAGDAMQAWRCVRLSAPVEWSAAASDPGPTDANGPDNPIEDNRIEVVAQVCTPQYPTKLSGPHVWRTSAVDPVNCTRCNGDLSAADAQLFCAPWAEVPPNDPRQSYREPACQRSAVCSESSAECSGEYVVDVWVLRDLLAQRDAPVDEPAPQPDEPSPDWGGDPPPVDPADIVCGGEFYDVNGDPADGCEVADDLPIHDSEENAAGMGSVDDCASVQRATGVMPSDDREHLQYPSPGPQGRPDFFALEIRDAGCLINADVKVLLGSLPAAARYELEASYECKDGKRLTAVTKTAAGGSSPVLKPSASCNPLGIGDDSGTLYVSVRKVSGPHSAASYEVEITP